VNGNIIIRRAGVLTISASLRDGSGVFGSNAATLHILVNGVDVSAATEARVPAFGVSLRATHHVRVAANDVVAIQAAPAEIDATVVGVQSQVAMTWTGVR
jgi:hypothetical protein